MDEKPLLAGFAADEIVQVGMLIAAMFNDQLPPPDLGDIEAELSADIAMQEFISEGDIFRLRAVDPQAVSNLQVRLFEFARAAREEPGAVIDHPSASSSREEVWRIIFAWIFERVTTVRDTVTH